MYIIISVYVCVYLYIWESIKEEVCKFTTVNPVQYSVLDTGPRRKSGACVLPSHLCPTKHIVTHDVRQVQESYSVTKTQKRVHKT